MNFGGPGKTFHQSRPKGLLNLDNRPAHELLQELDDWNKESDDEDADFKDDDMIMTHEMPTNIALVQNMENNHGCEE